jgi:hypothetical protein
MEKFLNCIEGTDISIDFAKRFLNVGGKEFRFQWRPNAEGAT